MLEVTFQGKSHVVKRLLPRKFGTNLKLAKNKRALTINLSLAPAKVSGHQTCPDSTAGCRAGCIFTAGNGHYPSVWLWRTLKTVAWFKERETFKAMLLEELAQMERSAKRKGMPLACRLNTFSDIAWDQLFPEVFERFPDVQFYDYTKSPKRMERFLRGELPVNWYLTFSRSEKNEAECLSILERGGTVAIPFRNGLPAEWNGFPVIDGDLSDERFLDPPGSVVGLKVKGKARSDRKSGFVVEWN